MTKYSMYTRAYYMSDIFSSESVDTSWNVNFWWSMLLLIFYNSGESIVGSVGHLVGRDTGMSK